MSNTVHQAREALGVRLRDLRRDAGLSGRRLAELAMWNNSKVSKIEHGKQLPTESDIRAWTSLCAATDQADDLIALVRDIEQMYVDWRRRLRTGTRRRQQKQLALENDAGLIRWYEPVLIPGLLHTAEYAAAVMRRVIAFYDVPDDLDAGVAARMERQQVLYRGKTRLHFILAEQALRTLVGDHATMAAQIDRLFTMLSLPRVVLGILPATTEYVVPTNQFILYDERIVHVETISAELTITPPREVGLYVKAFQSLSELAMYGTAARDLLSAALAFHRDASG